MGTGWVLAPPTPALSPPILCPGTCVVGPDDDIIDDVTDDVTNKPPAPPSSRDVGRVVYGSTSTMSLAAFTDGVSTTTASCGH